MITIEQLPSSAWQKYRDIRLEALLESPRAFGGTYEEEQFFEEARWREWITNMWFALDHGIPIGIVGLLKEESEKLRIISLWVIPSRRGQGIGKKLMLYVMDVARGRGVKKLHLSVTLTQGSAIHLYEKLGFVDVGRCTNCRQHVLMDLEL